MLTDEQRDQLPAVHDRGRAGVLREHDPVLRNLRDLARLDRRAQLKRPHPVDRLARRQPREILKLDLAPTRARCRQGRHPPR